MNKTLAAWRRFGREHGEDQGFRVNSADVVRAHIESRVAYFRETADDQWRWWQVNDDLIIEKPVATGGADTIIYYLPAKQIMILENPSFSSLPDWPWYVHMGTTEFDEKLDAWIFTDLFVDVIVKEDCQTHSIMDLDDRDQIKQDLGWNDS